MEDDEETVRKRRSGERKGVSAQFSSFVRENILQSAKGYSAACRYIGTFEHKHHPCLHFGVRRSTQNADTKARTFEVLK